MYLFLICIIFIDNTDGDEKGEEVEDVEP